jgi:hypothetical protein
MIILRLFSNMIFLLTLFKTIDGTVDRTKIEEAIVRSRGIILESVVQYGCNSTVLITRIVILGDLHKMVSTNNKWTPPVR